MTTDEKPSTPDLPWLRPDDPLPVRLMNTVWADRRGVHDALVTPADLRGWVEAGGLGPVSTPTRPQVTAARDLRDALRRLAAHVTRDERAHAETGMDLAAAPAAVNSVIVAAPEAGRLELVGGDLEWRQQRAGPPLVAALATVARSGADLLVDPGRPLRACYAPGCVLYFVKDHPRREWCSVACGNRARAARHYQRHRRR